jgi:hypothetical protein
VVTALSTDGTFDLDAPLAPNRVNDLYVTAIAPCGARSAPITVFVTQDSTPPVVRIDFPPDGAEFTTETVDVSGRVSDVLSGYQGLEVLVNGQPAAVDVGIGTNGTFFLPDLPLPDAGSLQIEAVAADGLGNTSADAITVSRVAIPPGKPQMRIVSGNGQSAVMHGWLAEPLRVQLFRPDGVTPFAGKVVTFEVVRSDGRLELAAEGDGALGGAGLRLLIAGVEVGTAVSGADGDFEIVARDATLGGAADRYVDASTIDRINGDPMDRNRELPRLHRRAGRRPRTDLRRHRGPAVHRAGRHDGDAGRRHSHRPRQPRPGDARDQPGPHRRDSHAHAGRGRAAVRLDLPARRHALRSAGEDRAAQHERPAGRLDREFPQFGSRHEPL